MRQPAASTVARPAEYAAGWVRSLEKLFAVPEPYRDECVDRAEALQTLRCGDVLLDELIERGLPCSGAHGDERFDRYDVFNLALYSESGRSVPEIAFQFALRWMAAPADSWFAPKHWTVRLGVQCGRAGGCSAHPSSSIALPRPDLFGGSLCDVIVEPSASGIGDGEVSLDSPGQLNLSCRVGSRGERMTLKSPRLAALVDEFMRVGYRWVRMPEGLQLQPELVLGHGVSNCISGSIHLERVLTDHGFQVRSRRGWVLGMLDIEHAWIEVVDDDGHTKAIDPIFALLAAHAPLSNPALKEVVLGSRMNRVLPTGHGAHQPLVRHTCGGSEAPIRRITEIRAVSGG